MNEIQVTLQTLEDALSHYHPEVLSPELDDYLSTQVRLLTTKQVQLNVHGLSKPKEQEKFQEVVHHYYERKTKVLLKTDSSRDIYRIVLLFLGIFFIVLASVLNFVLQEVILIAGWVAIWEMVSDVLFTEKVRRDEIKITKQLATCKILFDAKKSSLTS